MPNILIASPFFSPEMISTGKYNTYLAKALVEHGGSITVCCSHPLYPNWIPAKSTDGLAGMLIYRGGDRLRYPKSPLVRRLILELWFTYHVLSTVFRIKKNIDFAVVIFPPSLFVCFLSLVIPKHVKLVGIVHDLQGVLGLSGSGIIKRIFSLIVKQVETYGFMKCRRLILLSNGIKQQLIDAYGIDSGKCVVHYPFVTQSDEVISNNLADNFRHGFKHIVYSGAFGDKQNPYKLLELYESLVNERDDVICHVFSGGPTFETLKTNQKTNTLHRILFHDLVAENDLPELLSLSTLQIIPQKAGTSDAAFPSKLPNILAAGVPVFAITDIDSELSRLINASGIGSSCSSWDHDVLVPILLDFLDHVDSINRSVSRITVQEFVAKHFNVDNVIKEILEFDNK